MKVIKLRSNKALVFNFSWKSVKNTTETFKSIDFWLLKLLLMLSRRVTLKPFKRPFTYIDEDNQRPRWPSTSRTDENRIALVSRRVVFYSF